MDPLLVVPFNDRRSSAFEDALIGDHRRLQSAVESGLEKLLMDSFIADYTETLFI